MIILPGGDGIVPAEALVEEGEEVCCCCCGEILLPAGFVLKVKLFAKVWL